MPGLLAQASTLSDGFWLSVTGMLIVFFALTLVTLFIGWLPRVLGWINRIFPEPLEHHHPPRARNPADGIDEELVVAVAAAMDAHRRR
jgi:sodium pump decarboxylase gamma subunit